MWNNARVHESRGSVTVLVTEICTDEFSQCLIRVDGFVEVQSAGHLRKAPFENAFDLPMPLAEFNEHTRQLDARFRLGKRANLLDQLSRSQRLATLRVPCQLKGANYDTLCIGDQALGMKLDRDMGRVAISGRRAFVRPRRG